MASGHCIADGDEPRVGAAGAVPFWNLRSPASFSGRIGGIAHVFRNAEQRGASQILRRKFQCTSTEFLILTSNHC